MINKNLKKIRLVVFDFDGVFTDNCVYVDENGKETVKCTRADGIGLKLIKSVGIEVIVLSMEKNNVVKERCKKLNINCVNGCENKLEVLKKIISSKGIHPNEVCYVGNDTPDIACMKYVGFPVAVKNSHSEVIKIAKHITKKKGGEGAVREICECIYKAKIE
ncbi:MAG: HAD hydrolase family protein [Candidatus Micrarchaeia archaeon]